MFEFMGALMHMPTEFWIIMGIVVILLLLVAVWTIPLRSSSTDWYDAWTKRIDREIRHVRKNFKRHERKSAYVTAFAIMQADLEHDTGGMNLATLTIAQKSIWIYLITRNRDVMYFYR